MHCVWTLSCLLLCMFLNLAWTRFLYKNTPAHLITRARSKTASYSSRAFSMACHHHTSSPYKVSYVSDVEGNFDYWSRFVRFSSVLRGEAGARALELVDPQAHFVYGGDVCDRGPGDIRVIEDIIGLKEKYPDRVHIILGNRDINKMRLPFELHPLIGLGHPPKVYWLRGDENQFVTNPPPTSRELQTEASKRLDWILQKTMGSPLAFEYRRNELCSAGRPDSDDDVVKSFLDYVSPDNNPIIGPLTRYLQMGAVAVVIGDTLFVHGAVNPHNIGYVPPQGGSAARVVSDVRQWAAEINAFKDAEVAEYISGAQHWIERAAAGASAESAELYWAAEGGYAHSQPGSRLLQYGMGWLADSSLNPSVIYSWYDVDAQVPLPEQPVASWLLDSGVTKVVVGHQPRGDAPLVISNQGVTVISADTSYAANTLWPEGEGWKKAYSNAPSAAVRGDVCPPEDSTRGNIVSEVLISSSDRSSESSEVAIRGCLSDGSEYSFALPDKEGLVGSRTPTGWFVKATVGERYLLALLEGHSVKNRFVTKRQLSEEMAGAGKS